MKKENYVSAGQDPGFFKKRSGMKYDKDLPVL